MIIHIDNSKNKIENDWGKVNNGTAEVKDMLTILYLPLTHYIENTVGIVPDLLALQ